MEEYKLYQRKGLSEMTPYFEKMSIADVSISEADLKNGSPKIGDMIARNPKNHSDRWLVAEQYFKDNLELAKIENSCEICSHCYYDNEIGYFACRLKYGEPANLKCEKFKMA